MEDEKELLEKKLRISNILVEKYKSSENLLNLIIDKKVNIKEVYDKTYQEYLHNNASIEFADILLTETEFNFNSILLILSFKDFCLFINSSIIL